MRLERAPRSKALRTGDIPDIQLIGGAGRYEIDLLLRVLPGSDLEIVGQVTVADRVYEPVFGLHVALCDADTLAVVHETRTDPMGEFDMKGLRASRYALILGNDADAPCLFVWEGESHVPVCEAPL